MVARLALPAGRVKVRCRAYRAQNTHKIIYSTPEGDAGRAWSRCGVSEVWREH